MAHPAFEHLRSQRIDTLNLTVEEYRHKETGAQHIHLNADSDENVFLVALRTVPEDSTGVAHILEHTALCGSKTYPVRDPFFMMVRRSLNTFMNAFTSSDWTAYPFASQNTKDFNNLLDVYLDAVFFSRLDPLDFAQEGHRVEFAEPNNPDSDLVFKGVVFNEMKGAMSSVVSTLWQTFSKHLYPSTTYHYNSGGDPECIPDLSYEQLQAFYKTHYHPSNAIFMTFGNISADTHQTKFEDQALKHFEALGREINVPDEKRYFSPVRVEEGYAYEEAEATEGAIENKTHIVMGWLLGKSTNLEDALRAQLLSSVLFDNSASPMQHVLETTDLGAAPSPLCGLEDSQREMCFACGIEGSNPDKADDFEQLVLDTLSKVAEDGIPQEQIEASLHQLELQQREVGGDSYPYGLQLIMTGLTSATHRGDPVALMDLDPALNKLREEIKDPNFIKTQIQNLLLDNPHRVRLTLRPDANLAKLRDEAEAQRLATIKGDLSDEQKQAIIQQAQDLEARQLQKDDESILPKVGIEDVPPALHYVEGQEQTVGNTPLTAYAAGTNGLVYQQYIMKLPALTEAQLDALPLYGICLSEVGIGNADYLETQKRQSQICGSLSAYTVIRGQVHNLQQVDGHLILSAKGLSRNHSALTELMQETLEQVRFDELPRLRELIAQVRARREQSVTGSGHSLAMQAATSGFCPSAALSHRLSGLAGIRSIKQLDDAISADEIVLKNLAETMASIHKAVLAAPKQLLLVSQEENLADLAKQLESQWNNQEGDSFTAFSLPETSQATQALWVTNTQVNFCAKAYPTVTIDHPDAASLTVLGGFLRNGYLHRTIREQGGAYGGGASQDNNIGGFRFYSYRDPRLEETLSDFDKALEWLKNEKHEWQSVEEAILGVVSSIDKPSSPAGEAKQAFHAELHGRTREIRERFRQRVLEVKLEDLLRVADTYLVPDNASTAVVTHAGNQDLADQLGLSVETL